MGWGDGEWGRSEWGLGTNDGLQLLRAVPVRDNTVRLYFNEAPVFTRTLGPNDASNALRYQIVPIAGTLHGDDPRPVTPVKIEVASVAGGGGSIIDVTIDRPFSGAPALYRITVTQLVGASSGESLNPFNTSALFDGLEAIDLSRSIADLNDTRDFANPQSTITDPLIGGEEVRLGTIPTDSRGDYAFDTGIVNLRKRVLRRIISNKAGFAHLQDYGVGITALIKRLAKASTRATVLTDVEAQVSREPEVVAVKASFTETKPGLFRLNVKVDAPSLNPESIDFAFAINL